MTWITMSDGQEVSLKYPRAEDLCFRRLAHNISQINRFNGSAVRPYSVAEHSLLVLHIAQKHLNLTPGGMFATLNHDLHEGLTGDQTTPSKTEIGPGWHAFESKFEHLVTCHLQMVTDRYANVVAIATADRMAMAMERDQLLPKFQPNGLPSTPWPSLAKVPLLTDVDLMEPWRLSMTWDGWRDAFIEHHIALDRLRRQGQPARTAEVA